MDLVSLETGPLDVRALTEAEARGQRVGGVATFLGQVKGLTEQGVVTALELTADEPMAQRQMERLAGEARERYELVNVGLVHRLGRLERGETIVFVGANAAHRREALAACQWLIDKLKHKVHLWERELTPQGDRWVVPSGAETPS